MKNLLHKKVKIKENLLVDEFYGGLRFHNGMNKFKGKVTVVSHIPHYCVYAYNLNDCEGYDFTEEMLEIIE
ncbi:hypothetical protein Q3304_09260 [Clostridioides sp. GD02377]|uniref:hypothetical protein n=1 Tax=unclassified Clostridioides TaxID=2635829 RepID=UPI0038AFD1E0